MGIPIGMSYTTTATGNAARTVHCENCGEQFLFDVERKAEATRISLFFLNMAGARAGATADADEKLSDKLYNDVEPVPCPRCGLYQPDMVAFLRYRRYRWLKYLAIPFLMLSAIAGGLLAVGKINQDKLLAPALGSGGFGLLLLILRRALMARLDPNAGDPALRIQAGRCRAYRPTDVSRLLEDRTTRPSEGQLRSSRVQAFAGTWFWGVLGILSLGGGVLYGWEEVETLFDAHASYRWPMVHGKIIHSSRVVEQAQESEWTYAEIRYQFSVDGADYVSDHLWFGVGQRAERNLSLYPEGREVAVRYKPNDPSRCVLEPGVKGTEAYLSCAIVVIVVGFGLFALGCSIVKIRRYREMTRSLDWLATQETWRAVAAIPKQASRPRPS
jgi:hypothetical protein